MSEIDKVDDKKEAVSRNAAHGFYPVMISPRRVLSYDLFVNI